MFYVYLWLKHYSECLYSTNSFVTMYINNYKTQCCLLTSCPVSNTQSLEHCFLASINTLNMVQTDSGTRKSVDLLDFCILESNADFVLEEKTYILPALPISLQKSRHDIIIKFLCLYFYSVFCIGRPFFFFLTKSLTF